jgi:hypothetical protein
MALKRGTKTFELNQLSRYEVAQLLWKMMEDDEEEEIGQRVKN